jgi:hypothetical protein
MILPRQDYTNITVLAIFWVDTAQPEPYPLLINIVDIIGHPNTLAWDQVA